MMKRQGCARVVVKTHPEFFKPCFIESMIPVDDRLRCRMFLICRDGDRDSMFIRSAEKRDVSFHGTLVTDIDIRRKVCTCKMTKVNFPICIRKRGGNKYS